MTEKLKLDNDWHELKLGDSFSRRGDRAFHSIRYDFKPASVDTAKRSNVEVGQGNQVTVTVPHVEGAGTTQTVYKGNKRPVQKECVLVIDHATGEFTLERLSTTIQLKKTRTEGSSKAQRMRPITPVDKLIKEHRASPAKRKGVKKGSSKAGTAAPSSSQSHSQTPSPTPTPTPTHPPSQSSSQSQSSGGHHSSQSHAANQRIASKEGQQHQHSLVGDISDSSSSGSGSSSSSSDSEDEQPNRPKPVISPTKPKPHTRVAGKDFHMLTEDLQLSESGSDSD